MRSLQMVRSVSLRGMSSPSLPRLNSQRLLVPAVCNSSSSSSSSGGGGGGSGGSNMRGGSQKYNFKVLSKNLELISIQGPLHIEDSHRVILHKNQKTRPLVVMLAYLLAKRKHLLKFADFYLDQGFDVLTVAIQPWQMLLPTRGTQVLAEEILRFLHVNTCYDPMMLHGFSVGGYVWAEVLVKMNEDKEKYRHVVDRFVGQVWDSIADISEIPVGFPRAVFPNNPVLRVAAEKYCRYHLTAFYNIATVHYIRAGQMFQTSVIRSPGLFFLSKSDPIGAAESILRVVDCWDAQGIKTYVKCWEQSPHVMHYRQHPKEYASELYAFLDRLGLVSNPEKFRAKL